MPTHGRHRKTLNSRRCKAWSDPNFGQKSLLSFEQCTVTPAFMLLQYSLKMALGYQGCTFALTTPEHVPACEAHRLHDLPRSCPLLLLQPSPCILQASADDATQTSHKSFRYCVVVLTWPIMCSSKNISPVTDRMSNHPRHRDQASGCYTFDSLMVRLSEHVRSAFLWNSEFRCFGELHHSAARPKTKCQNWFLQMQREVLDSFPDRFSCAHQRAVSG